MESMKKGVTRYKPSVKRKNSFFAAFAKRWLFRFTHSPKGG
jgi:hypothetical protein